MSEGKSEAEKRAALAGEKYVASIIAERGQYVAFMKDYGQETIKTLLLLHGGSIAALLTFFGALLSKGDAQLRIAAATIDATVPALVCFGLGLALTAAISVFGYLNFGALAELAPDSTEVHDWMKGHPVPPRPTWLHALPSWSARAAMIAGSLSFLLFLVGAMMVAVNSFPVLVGQAYVEGAPMPLTGGAP